MITIIQNTNTLLRIAYPLEDQPGEIVDIYIEGIVGWQVTTKEDPGGDMHSCAEPVTDTDTYFDPSRDHAIYNKFTEEWDIPYGQTGKGRESLIAHWRKERDNAN